MDDNLFISNDSRLLSSMVVYLKGCNIIRIKVFLSVIRIKKLCYVKQPKLTKFCPSAQRRTPRRVYYLWGPNGLRLRPCSLMARIKILINMDISVLRFYWIY